MRSKFFSTEEICKKYNKNYIDNLDEYFGKIVCDFITEDKTLISATMIMCRGILIFYI